MSLAAPNTLTAMDAEVTNIMNGLPQTEESIGNWNASQAWAPVATAFFSGATIPSVTPAGISAGEGAFITACQASAPGTNSVNQESLAAGFTAYAAAVCTPGSCAPPAPVVHAPPTSQLVLNLENLPASMTTLPSTSVLHSQLLAWAVTGTQTTPGAPPVVVPWA